jgi:hypothetical protein
LRLRKKKKKNGEKLHSRREKPTCLGRLGERKKKEKKGKLHSGGENPHTFWCKTFSRVLGTFMMAWLDGGWWLV